MPPKEADPLLVEKEDDGTSYRKQFSISDGSEIVQQEDATNGSFFHQKKYQILSVISLLGLCIGLFFFAFHNEESTTSSSYTSSSLRHLTGPYKLIELQEGSDFFNYYDFYDGPDSLGSAGYQTYVGKKRADELNLANVTKDPVDGKDYIYMQSTPGVEKGGFRESVRLEGKRRFDRGLFVLDVAHMPAGCGIWPAFWLTDEDTWPDNGEIDIVEGINTQSVVKTALHTSEDCDMFAHVPYWEKTGTWDSSTGLPDTFSGLPNYNNKVEADNCWVMAPHQWANQGCVAVSSENGTIGTEMNDIGGGVYVLDWDPTNGYIKSWVFKRGSVPDNLLDSMSSASSKEPVVPEPESWPLPYAYFAIGDRSGCSNDHFKNMRLIFNLAFSGTVAGNRFFRDCPALSEQWNVQNNSVLTCNAFIASEPDVLSEAYWKVGGVYVYEREYERMSNSDANQDA